MIDFVSSIVKIIKNQDEIKQKHEPIMILFLFLLTLDLFSNNRFHISIYFPILLTQTSSDK